jgi:hypothetical protein
MPREVYNQILETLLKFSDGQLNLKSEACRSEIAAKTTEDLLQTFMFIERETKKEIN